MVHWEQPNAGQIRRRRRYYGRSGEHRIKNFGIEYRTLPSSAFHPIWTDVIWDLSERGLNMDAQDIQPLSEDISLAIQTCDPQLAGELMEEIKL